jgi:hypothetical protein
MPVLDSASLVSLLARRRSLSFSISLFSLGSSFFGSSSFLSAFAGSIQGFSLVFE